MTGARPRRFELQGHRGARGLFPENTLAGFVATLAIGVDTIELDVAVTADGAVVVTHDTVLNPDLTRAADGAWLAAPGPAIRDLTVAELAGYDVGRLRPGSRLAALLAGQTPCDGARIPLLSEVFAATAPARIDAELKTQPDCPKLTLPAADMAELVLAEAAAASALGRLTLRSFDWRGLRHVRARRGDVALVWLTSPATVARARMWWDGPLPEDFHGSVPACVAAEAGEGRASWAPEHSGLTPALIAEAQGLGLRVLPWTVNTPEDMARLISWGVDGFCTDRPDLARTAMRAAGLPLPEPVPKNATPSA
jgi:glycerophosphoryl diester phosphodiesterase